MPDALQTRLRMEFERRKTANGRYSLRSFARLLGTHHSTLSQIMSGRRRAPRQSISRWLETLGVTREEISVYTASEMLPDARQRERQAGALQWTSESLAVMADDCHWFLFRAAQMPGFRANSVELANHTGLSADRINIALSRLLRLRILTTGPTGAWRCDPSVPARNAAGFRAQLLDRLQQELWPTP